MSLTNLRLQEHLREAITWVDKGFVSKEEFEVLKYKMFLEDKNQEDEVSKLAAANALLKGENARLKEDMQMGEDEHVDCSRDGIEYSRNREGTVYNDEFEVVGKWCYSLCIIEFTNEGAKKHFEATGRILPH